MENAKEVWKDIDINKNYMISNMGNIYSKINNRNLSPGKSRGYYYIALGRKNKNLSVHRLVARHFIPNPENKPQVNHKNGIKHCNSVDNLEWVTLSENMIHAMDFGLWKNRGEDNLFSKLDNYTVLKIREMFNSGSSYTDIMKRFEISRPQVSRIIMRKIWKHI